MTDRISFKSALNWSVDKAASELACLAPTCNLALGVTKLKMTDGGLAEKMLDHFRSGDASEVEVDLNPELARNPRLRELLSERIESDILQQITDGKDVEDISGAIWVSQADYGQSDAGLDQKLAFGGTFFEYRVVGTADDGGVLTELQVSDDYFWSPSEPRATQCLHECGAALVRNHEATEFHQYGEGSLSVADPRKEQPMEALPPEPEVLR